MHGQGDCLHPVGRDAHGTIPVFDPSSYLKSLRSERNPLMRIPHVRRAGNIHNPCFILEAEENDSLGGVGSLPVSHDTRNADHLTTVLSPHLLGRKDSALSEFVAQQLERMTLR